ncbi:GNAT family N-acetyltransferase [Burkholderia glumae]|uniref:GNAT family N-acetyltransferase n=1 Tax=Burkholderia glumae TaxID=337 RepID=UPI0018DED33C|nr:GNAT family N-acetyltransferase [Burkholderia glumae]
MASASTASPTEQFAGLPPRRAKRTGPSSNEQGRPAKISRQGSDGPSRSPTVDIPPFAEQSNAGLHQDEIVVLTENQLPQFTASLKHDVEHCGSTDEDRVASTMEMLDSLSVGFSKDKYDVIAHRLRGRSSGVLVLEKGEPAKVLAMVTHPNSKGVGSALMEQAVNLAKNLTGKAELHLEVMDAAAAAAYQKMGFVMSQASDSDSDSDITCEPMVLNANDATNWKEDSNGYMLMTNRKPPHFVG